MNMKKNLTVAGLVALLGVPALNSTHINNNLHIPSVTAHAANLGFGDDDNPYARESWHDSGNSGYFGGFYRNGHYFDVAQRQPGGAIVGIDGNDSVTNAQVKAALNGTGNNINDGDKAGNTNGLNGFNSNDSTQYSPNKLPQADESDTNNKAKIISLATTALGLSSLALNIIRKHKRNSIKSINNASLSNNR